MLELSRKTFNPTLTFKADSPGSLSVEFASLNVLDHDGDITLPGAFGEQHVRIQSHGHDTRSWTIGKGIIRESADKAVMEGLLNLDMTDGKNAHASLKFDLEHGTPLQEWSYVFEIMDADFAERDGREVRMLKRLKVHSVDPVFLGAGIGTHTMGIKSVSGLAYAEFCDEVVSIAKEFCERTKTRSELRGKEGRTLSAASVSKITSVAEALGVASSDLLAMLSESAPKNVDEGLAKLRLEYERIRTYTLR